MRGRIDGGRIVRRECWSSHGDFLALTVELNVARRDEGEMERKVSRANYLRIGREWLAARRGGGCVGPVAIEEHSPHGFIVQMG